MKTTVQVDTGRDTNISFRREGAYASSVKSIVIELLCKEIAPVQVMLQDRRLPMFLDSKAWEAAEEGWYYDLERKTAKIKYGNGIETDYEIGVHFDVKDLISI